MDKERLSTALEKITDTEWNFFDTFTKKDAPLHLEFITPGEAGFFRVIGQFIPEKYMPFIVGQWAGIDGRVIFEKELQKK